MERLEEVQYRQSQIKRLLEDRLPRPRRAEYEEYLEQLAQQEKAISKQIIVIEGCDHAEVEDTGVPDGSQVCLDCGRVR
jgi:hypothetical protein